jgi:hypothetical protein
MKFQSEYFDTAEELAQAKTDAWAAVKERRDRLSVVRRFTNMMNTLTEEEAEELGRVEITNHGLTHRDMLQNETGFTSMVTVTNSLLDLVVDTDNAEKDLETSFRINEAINRGALHFKGKLANFWRKVSGEIVMAGGGPVTQNEKYGWLPKLRPDMFFPKGTSLDAEEVTYAFDPKELTISDLRKLRSAVKGDQSCYIDVASVDQLIEAIEKQIRQNTKNGGSSFGEEISRATREFAREESLISIPAFWYYEVKFRDDGSQYVSSTLFMDGINGIDLERKGIGEGGKVTQIIAYIDEAYETASDWLHIVSVDSEIGGVKNMDTLKGVAEMTYASSVEMEELLNLMMEGDKIRARPKIRLMDNADADALAKWNIMTDLYAPPGVEEMPFKNDSRGLMTPFSMLNQNAAGMSNSSVSNGTNGGELRQQAVERQANSAMLQTNRISEAYNHLDSILETVVWRILAGAVKPGTDGYHEIMWIRDRLDKYGIDYRSLASRKHGRFEYLRVRARRAVGNGDRVQQLDTADWLMQNLQNYAPTVRPRIIHAATVLRTQDPDMADSLTKIPKAIINAQKLTAENEYDTIARRASLGQILPVAEDDVHQDHIPTHLVDMQAHIARHGQRPWDKLDVVIFAGVTEHTAEHLKILMTNPVTNAEGAAFIQDFQNIAQAAQAIVAEVEQAEGGNDQAQLTQKEQADIQLKWMGYELEGRKLGIKMEDMQRLWNSRAAREALQQRQTYVKEINEDRRLKLDKERVDNQALAQKNKPKAAIK